MGNKKSRVDEHDIFQEKNNLFSTLRKWINRASYLLIPLFGWLQINEIFFENPPSLDDTFVKISLRIIVAIWFSSWVFGLGLDVIDQSEVILDVDKNNKLHTSTVTIIITFIFAFAIMAEILDLRLIYFFYPRFVITTHFKIECLLICITFFHFQGHYAEIHTQKIAKEIIEHNKKIYLNDKNLINFQLLKVIENYYFKTIDVFNKPINWFKLRFYCGIIIITIVNIAFFSNLSNYFAEKLGTLLSLLTSQRINITSDIINICAIAIFLTILEGWNWYERFIRTISLKVLNNIKSNNDIILTLRK